MTQETTRHTDPAAWRETLYLAAINCSHVITDDQIVLHRDPAKDGSALSQMADRLAAEAVPGGAAEQPSKPTDISQRLREYANNPGYSHNDYADTMRAAAEEIERYYTGMLNWKATAEAKDSAYLAGQSQAAQPSIKPWKQRLGGVDSCGRPYDRDIDAANHEIAELRRALARQSRAAPVAKAVPDELLADLSGLTLGSVRDFPDFREDLERLSAPGLAKKQAKIIRKEIYDTIDARVRNAVKAAQAAQEVTQQAAPADILEQIAQSWDGCEYDSVGETLDIGVVLRDQFKKLAPVTQQAAKAETAERANELMRKALEDIAQPADAGCGCSFPCRCSDDGAEAINAGILRGIASDTLAEVERRCRAQRTNKDVESSGRATTTSTVSAPVEPIGYVERAQLEWLARSTSDTASVQLWRTRAPIDAVAVHLVASSSAVSAPEEVRNQALEDAAKVAEDTDVATREWAMQRYDDGSQTRSDIVAAIRALRTTTDKGEAA